MRKIFSFFCAFLLLISCNSNRSANSEESESVSESREQTESNENQVYQFESEELFNISSAVERFGGIYPEDANYPVEEAYTDELLNLGKSSSAKREAEILTVGTNQFINADRNDFWYQGMLKNGYEVVLGNKVVNGIINSSIFLIGPKSQKPIEFINTNKLFELPESRIAVLRSVPIPGQPNGSIVFNDYTINEGYIKKLEIDYEDRIPFDLRVDEGNRPIVQLLTDDTGESPPEYVSININAPVAALDIAQLGYEDLDHLLVFELRGLQNSQSDINLIKEAFKNKSSFGPGVMELFYPGTSRTSLFNAYRRYQDTGSLSNFKALSMHEVTGDLLFQYEFDCNEFEGIAGRRSVVRLMREGRWVQEISSMTGVGSGANVTSHEGLVEWAIDGFQINYESLTTFPFLTAVFDGAKAEMGVKDGHQIETNFMVSEEGFAISSTHQDKVRKFEPKPQLIDRLKNGATIEEILAEEADISDENRSALKKELYKARQETISEVADYAEVKNADKILDMIVAKRIEDGVEATYSHVADIGRVKFYEISQNENKVIIAFNTLNNFFRYGDSEEDIVDLLKNNDLKYFSAFSGWINVWSDVNGDGKDDLLIKDYENYNTSYSGNEYVLFLNEYNELIQANISARGDFEDGICEKIVGKSSAIELTSDGIVVKDEWGGSDCNDQKYRTYTRSYIWNSETGKFERKS